MEGKQSVSDRIRRRTIMDMLQEDDDQASGSKKSWKTFRDKLRLKKAGAAWTSTLPVPASDIPIQTNTNRKMMRRGSARYPSDPNVDNLDAEGTRQLGRQRSVRLLPLETDDPEEDENEKNSSENDHKSPHDENKSPAAAAAEEGGLKSQTSLMALLEDYAVEDEGEHHDAEAVEGVVEEEEEIDGDYSLCGGCRGKHKGAAVGPCGHTFCKGCTRELHVCKAHCPTCNKVRNENDNENCCLV